MSMCSVHTLSQSPHTLHELSSRVATLGVSRSTLLSVTRTSLTMRRGSLS